MIIRVVKMTFKEEEMAAFQQLFDERKSLIRNFEGCTHLELWQDKQHPQVFFTYSWWESEAALNCYRESKFFDETWQLTKIKFAERPQAWSLEKLHHL